MKYKSSKQYRLQGFDYTAPGWYFITICTLHRIPYFGSIRNQQMSLSDIGHIVEIEWTTTVHHRPGITLDAWVIMPDHFHGIINISHQHQCRNAPRRVPTGIHPLIPQSIGSIINHFKGSVTRQCRRNGHINFHWQPRFYDRIIRSQRELDAVRRYIIDNPKNWNKNF